MHDRRHPALAIAFLLLACGGLPACANLAPDDRAPHERTLQRWEEMRFGMFVHWGPVAQAGTEIGWSRGKQVRREEYDALYRTFDPTEFDAREWARIAREAGMKYLVLTAKHHDGFCLWDSALTDYDVMNSPFGRDVIAELAEACAAEGIELGLYYSILDWYQPDYNTAGSQGGPGYALAMGDEADLDRYQEYLHGQLRELSERYGPLLTVWFDGEWEEPWTLERGVRLFQFCRELDPAMLVNNRVGRDRQGMAGTTAQDADNPGDYDTPEQRVGAFQADRPWETCMTICRQWAWKPNDQLKSFDECIRTLVRTAGGDGNLLFNVGPMPDGRIEPRQVERLREMGTWLREHGESIYDTRGGPFLPDTWGVSTHRGRTVYVHVFDLEGEELRLAGIEPRIVSAEIPHHGELPFTQTDELITVTIPASFRDEVDTIVELKLDAPVAGPAKRPSSPSPFDLGLHGEWLSEHARYDLSSRVEKWSQYAEHLLTADDYPGDWAFHTARERNPSITIDLGRVDTIRGLEILNRRHDLQERAAGLTLHLSADGETWHEAWRADSVQNQWHAILETPMPARYIKLSLPGDEERYLHLFRVRVFGDRGD